MDEENDRENNRFHNWFQCWIWLLWFIARFIFGGISMIDLEERLGQDQNEAL